MKKQLIVTIGREFGSGGRNAGLELAKRLDLPMYDKDLLRHIAFEGKLDLERLTKYDEVPRKKILSRTVKDYNNSPEESVAKMQFDYLRKLAHKGESFIVVGRCAETVLAGNDGLISIFISADPADKITKTMREEQVTKEEAEEMIEKYNRQRKEYHNYYCNLKFGDSRNYDLCINASRLGFEDTIDMLEAYIKKRVEAWS